MKKNKILVLSYYGVKDPLFLSTVYPYFDGLDKDKTLEFYLLTFERKEYECTRAEIDRFENDLKKNNFLKWHRGKYHSGKFKAFKKIYDFLQAFFLASYMIIRYRPKAIYCLTSVGGLMGYILSRIYFRKLIVHTYEPHSEYMVDSGVWTPDYWGTKLLARAEKKIGMNATFILTATNNMIDRLKEWKSKATAIRVPSCVDSTAFFPDAELRNKKRKELNYAESDCVITYLGKYGGIYYKEEVFEFFQTCIREGKMQFKFLLITQDPHELVYDLIKQFNLDKNLFTVLTLGKGEVNQYLNAADFGFVPVRQGKSKKFCSPVKDGEYWAVGLPILIFDGISDDYNFSKNNNIGIVIKDSSEKSYTDAVGEIENWLQKENASDVKMRCRKFAIEDRSIDKYKEIYRTIFKTIG